MGRQGFSSDLVVTTPMTFAEVGTYVMKYFVVPKSAVVITSSLKSKLEAAPVVINFKRAAITSSDLTAISDKSLEVTVNVVTGSVVPTVVQPAPPAAPGRPAGRRSEDRSGRRRPACPWPGRYGCPRSAS